MKKITIIVTEKTNGENVECNVKTEFMGDFPGGVHEIVKYLSFAIDDLNKLIEQKTSMN